MRRHFVSIIEAGISGRPTNSNSSSASSIDLKSFVEALPRQNNLVHYQCGICGESNTWHGGNFSHHGEENVCGSCRKNVLGLGR